MLGVCVVSWLDSGAGLGLGRRAVWARLSEKRCLMLKHSPLRRSITDLEIIVAWRSGTVPSQRTKEAQIAPRRPSVSPSAWSSSRWRGGAISAGQGSGTQIGGRGSDDGCDWGVGPARGYEGGDIGRGGCAWRGFGCVLVCDDASEPGCLFGCRCLCGWDWPVGYGRCFRRLS